jgi:hypothetical protein
MKGDYELVSAHLTRGGKPSMHVILAARRLANKCARLRAAAGAPVCLSPWMLSLLRLDRNGNVRH